MSRARSGAQEISRQLGGLPVVSDDAVPPSVVRVVLADDYTGPGSGLDGSYPASSGMDQQTAGTTEDVPPQSPILTAGPSDPACVN